MQVDIVIKLGGAAITNKIRLETIDENVLDKTLDCIASLYRSGHKFILVHGAGSFGHFPASRAGLSQGGNLVSADQLPLAIAETHASVTKLNHLIVSKLIQLNIPAVGVSPFPLWTCKQRRIAQHGCEQVGKILESGMLPVLHGDVVLDSVLGCTILSGDQLVEHLCKIFRPHIAVFMTNTLGVFDRPPDQQGSRLIRSIRVDTSGGNYNATLKDGTSLTSDDVKTERAQHDTTGGMEAKIKEACEIAVHSQVPVRIVLAGSEHAEIACIEKKKQLPETWMGTEILCL